MKIPLLSTGHHQQFSHSTHIVSFICVASILLIFISGNFSSRISIESLVGGIYPPVTNQLIKHCVDLKDTCMGEFVRSRRDYEWGPAIFGNDDATQPQQQQPSEPTVKRRKSSDGSSGGGSSSAPTMTAFTHAVPPICSDLGEATSESLKCDSYDEIYDTTGQILGEGSGGQVEHIKLKDQIAADENLQPKFWNRNIPNGIVKMMARRSTTFFAYREAIISQAVRQRISVGAALMSVHFAWAVDVYGDKTGRQGNVVMQPQGERTLADPRYRNLFKGDEQRAKRLAIQLLEMIHALHTYGGFVHSDIKPLNLLVSGNTIVLTDWGTAMPIQNDGTFYFDSAISVGTTSFSSPENIRAHVKKEEGSYHSPSTDIFMVGATVFLMYFGFAHYPEDGNTFQIANYMMQHYQSPIIRAESRVPCDPFCQLFWSKLMARDPSHRFTIEQALAHEWLTSVDSGALDLQLPATAPILAQAVVHPLHMVQGVVQMPGASGSGPPSGDAPAPS